MVTAETVKTGGEPVGAGRCFLTADDILILDQSMVT